MGRTGVANLPLHGGKAPSWLFKRMVKLSRGIADVMIEEYSRDEFIKRLSNPFWFQALSCVLGFDWHSSGTTTVTCGALKEAIDPEIHGFAVVGGKGKASRKTLEEIDKSNMFFNLSSKTVDDLKYSSRMAAKVDNSALQDSHSLYHHVFVFSEDGIWSVIQQGLNTEDNYARRYHWFSKNFDSFIKNPHDSILGEKVSNVLDMSSGDSEGCQKSCVDLVNDDPVHLKCDWASLLKHKDQTTLFDWDKKRKTSDLVCLDMPRSISWHKMKEIYEFQPSCYEELLGLRGVGPGAVRALALISDLIYGEKPSWKDPVKFTFAHGGKDGVPFPVDCEAMDESTMILRNGINQAKIGRKDRLKAIKRLSVFVKSSNKPST
jgi:uncharacterized protein